MGRIVEFSSGGDSIAAQIWRDAERRKMTPDQLNRERLHEARLAAGGRHRGDESGQGRIAVAVAMETRYQTEPTVAEPEPRIDPAGLEASYGLEAITDGRQPSRPEQFADTSAYALGALTVDDGSWRDDSWFRTYQDIQGLPEPTPQGLGE